MKYCLLVLSCLLVGCGGRVANPVAIEKSLDSRMTCSHLQGEYDQHEKRLVELVGERKDKPVHNLGMLVTSPLFLDLSKAQKKEAEAIYSRKERLEVLMSQKNCAKA